MDKGQGIRSKYLAMRDMVVTIINDFLSGRMTIVVGLLILVPVVLLTMAYPCPSKSQFLIIRLLLAAGIACVMLGFVTLFSDTKSASYIKAGISIVIFTIAFYTNPAMMVVTDDCHLNYDFIEGHVVLAGKPVEGATLSISEQDHLSQTNSAGQFFLPFYRNRPAENRSVRLQWNRFDTLVNLAKSQPDGLIRIELPAYVQRPPKYAMEKIVQERVRKCNEWIMASHQGYLDRYHGQEEVTLKQLIRNCAPYEKINSRYGNDYEFTNGHSHVKFRKNLVQIGIHPNDFKLENSFRLEYYKPFLLKKKTDKKAFNITYSLFNDREAGADILSVLPQPDGTCHVLVSYEEPVRYLFVTQRYNGETRWHRQRRMQFMGFMPTETLVLERRNGQWKLSDIE